MSPPLTILETLVLYAGAAIGGFLTGASLPATAVPFLLVAAWIGFTSAWVVFFFFILLPIMRKL